jgi:hypothetical protein
MMALMNVTFTAAFGWCIPLAHKYEPHKRMEYIQNLGLENVTKVFAALAAILGLTPFASSLVVRAMQLGNNDIATGEMIIAGKGRVGKDKVRNLDLGIVGFRADGGSELSASALCFKDNQPQELIIRENLVEVTPRVTFDDRVLQSTSELICDSVTGEMFTVLCVHPPESIDGIPPIGRAWLVAGYTRRKHVSKCAGLAKKEIRSRLRLVDSVHTFEPVGEAVPILLLPDPEAVQEVNNAVTFVLLHMDVVKANRFVMRLVNCITRATYNPNDMEVMIEVVSTLGLKRCEEILHAMSREFELEKNCGVIEMSVAPNDGTIAMHDGKARCRWRSTKSSTSENEDNGDEVDGPDMSSLQARNS